MAFSDFTYPQVQTELGLVLQERHLYQDVSPVSLRADFVNNVKEGAALALGIATEKAKSEFIIAPILLELHRVLGGNMSLFSGVEFNVDPSRGLTGVCDFILSKSPLQSILSAPVVTIVEAKNDNLRHGYGQCIAAMVAAELYNQKTGVPSRVVHGAVSTGSAWKFLRLEGTTVTLDIDEYYIDNLGMILGILKHLLETA